MNVDLLPVLPAILVAVTGILVLLAGAFGSGSLAASRNLAIGGLGATVLFILLAPPAGSMGGTIIGGAYSAFDAGASARLEALLRAAASYAAGGYAALALQAEADPAARLLLSQMRGS